MKQTKSLLRQIPYSCYGFLSDSATWTERAEQDGGAADEGHRLSARPLHLQQRGPEKVQLLLQNIGQDSRAEVTEPRGSSEDVPLQGGECHPGSHNHRESVSV